MKQKGHILACEIKGKGLGDMSLRFLVKRPRKYARLLLPVCVFTLIILGVMALFFCAHKLVVYLAADQEMAIEEDTVTIKVFLHETQEVVEMGLEEYIVGVVAAEMPASFSLEALKAQAVAARTYAVKRLFVPDSRVKESNQEADISTDHTINQAWISTAEMKSRWGKWNFAANREKIVQAVEATRGKVLVYNGQIVDPAYHASCGGKGTENSGDVWKVDVPYLKGVACTGHQDRHQAETHFFSLQKLDSLLGTSLNTLPASKLTIGGKGALSIKEKSNSGRIREATISEKTFSGTELRTKLALPSTRFSWKIKDGGVLFQTNGYGHGVGMCQYGANDLAQQGKNYEEILRHYYSGVEIARIKTGKGK
jgi:stage II sporulation protein D